MMEMLPVAVQLKVKLVWLVVIPVTVAIPFSLSTSKAILSQSKHSISICAVGGRPSISNVVSTLGHPLKSTTTETGPM